MNFNGSKASKSTIATWSILVLKMGHELFKYMLFNFIYDSPVFFMLPVI